MDQFYQLEDSPVSLEVDIHSDEHYRVSFADGDVFDYLEACEGKIGRFEFGKRTGRDTPQLMFNTDSYSLMWEDNRVSILATDARTDTVKQVYEDVTGHELSGEDELELMNLLKQY